jgi:hypothetical protein
MFRVYLPSVGSTSHPCVFGFFYLIFSTGDLFQLFFFSALSFPRTTGDPPTPRLTLPPLPLALLLPVPWLAMVALACSAPLAEDTAVAQPARSAHHGHPRLL